MKRLLLLTFTMCACMLTALAQQTYKTVKNISYYPDTTKLDQYAKSTCTIDLYYPENTKDFPTVLWFHGGSLTGGGKEIPKALLEKGIAVIGVGYRLSPKVKSPTYVEDAAAATAWAFKHIAEYGGRPNLIFMSGHSAGGYLDLMVGLDKSYLAKYGIDANKLAGLIPFSPQAITHFTVRQERGIPPLQPIIDNMAPLYFVRADAPPILLITGDRELELYGRYDENAYLNRMFKLIGSKTTRLYELQGYDHGGMAEPAFPLLVKEIKALTKNILTPVGMKE